MEKERKKTAVFRFAPSPNGYLHLGHAYSALYSYHAAKTHNARFLLRIEDIDTTRSRQIYIDQIFKDLEWLGLEWDLSVRYQSQYFDDYEKTLVQLDRQSLLYPCFATRSEIRQVVASDVNHPKDPDGSPIYPGIWRHASSTLIQKMMQENKPYVLRLDMQKALSQLKARGHNIRYTEMGEIYTDEERVIDLDPSIWGDVVLKRKEIRTSYHLSVVHDDSVQEITHVSRGADLLHATSIHRLLQILLEMPEPVYMHHRLIEHSEGVKLSKSAGHPSLKNMRESGVSAQEIKGSLGFPDC